MPIKSNCENCEFFKVHKYFSEKCVENIGGTCQIQNKTSKTVVGNEVITFELETECPLKKIKEYEKMREWWGKFKHYIAHLEANSDKFSSDYQKVLLDIMIKMKRLENGKGE